MAIKSIYLHSLRVLFIGFLSLLVVHLFAYPRLPWETGYHFPTKGYLIIFSFGFLICTINWLVYGQVRNIPLGSRFNRFLILIGINILVTVTSYSVLYPVINVWILGHVFILANFLKFLFVILMIITTEFALVILYRMNERGRPGPDLLIDTGSSRFRIDPGEIVCFKSHAGMIRAYLKSEKSYATQYGSLDELREYLNQSNFFQINRRFIVNREAISSIRKDRDRRLRVFLETRSDDLLEDQIVVSRYRNKPFSSWFAKTNP